MERSHRSAALPPLQIRWHAAICAASADALDRLVQARLSAASVHRIRVQTKRLRAFVALCQPLAPQSSLAAARQELRWTARRLARRREVTALLALAGRMSQDCELPADREALASLRMALRQPRAAPESAKAQARMRASFELAQHTLLAVMQEHVVEDLVQQGLARSRRRCLATFARAVRDPRPARLHAWRKRVKALAIQLDATRDAAWRRSPLRRRLHELGTLLGELHDTSVLRSKLDEFGADLDAAALARIARLVRQRERKLLRHALAVGGECRDDLRELELVAERRLKT